jgi:hypothetical protein
VGFPQEAQGFLQMGLLDGFQDRPPKRFLKRISRVRR